MINGSLSLIELVKRAYVFSECYKKHGVEGFSTGSMANEYRDLLEWIDQLKLEHLEIDNKRLADIWEPNIIKIAQIFSNKELNIGLIFIPKDW